MDKMNSNQMLAAARKHCKRLGLVRNMISCERKGLANLQLMVDIDFGFCVLSYDLQWELDLDV